MNDSNDNKFVRNSNDFYRKDNNLNGTSYNKIINKASYKSNVKSNYI